MILSIPGNPIPKARARTVRRGAYISTYDPQHQTKQSFKNEIECAIRTIYSNQVPLPIFVKNIAIEARLSFFLPYPKNSNTWLIEKLAHKTKPDIDNLEKFICDCLSGLAFNDDRQIISIYSKKEYSHNPRTEIELLEKKEPMIQPHINEILTTFSTDDAKKLHLISTQIMQKVNEFSFESEPEVWAQATTQLLTELSQNFSKKLAKIKKIDDLSKKTTTTSHHE